MCKVITIINKNKKNTKLINNLLVANLNNLKVERDGYSVLRDGVTSFHLGLCDYQNIKYAGEETYILHTRTSTGGEAGIGGLHLQNVKGYRFAHNGMVSAYAGFKQKNDSYYFCADLVAHKKITKRVIEKEIKICGFNGKGFLYHKKTGDTYIFNNSAIHVYGLENCLIFSSYALETEIKDVEMVEVLGFVHIEESNYGEKIPFLFEETIDDQFIHFSKGVVLEHQNMESTYGFWRNQQNQQNYKNYKNKKSTKAGKHSKKQKKQIQMQKVNRKISKEVAKEIRKNSKKKGKVYDLRTGHYHYY